MKTILTLLTAACTLIFGMRVAAQDTIATALVQPPDRPLSAEWLYACGDSSRAEQFRFDQAVVIRHKAEPSAGNNK